MANGHWPLLLYKSYTCYTHGVKAFQELYSYTTLYSIQLYIAIHYTTSTTPLWALVRIFLAKVSFLRRKTNNTQAPGQDTPHGV